jgi:multicomponent Na+:H+ antiporter subunit F
MNVVIGICLGILALAGAVALLRVMKPRVSLADRMIALDLILLIIVMAIAVSSVGVDDPVFLDVLVVVSLLGFVGTFTVARFIERRGL